MSDQSVRESMPDPAQAAPDLPDWLQEVTGDRDSPAQVRQRFSPVGVILVLAVVGLLAVIAYALIERNKPTPDEGPAPDFAITTWNLDNLAMPNERLTLDSLKGKVVVLNFWASWCIPCQKEAPMFERLWNQYKDRNVVFLGVNTEDTDTAVFAYIREYGLTYPHAPDEGGRMEDDYRITGIPETFIIDPDGEIIHHFISSPSNDEELRAQIERALSGS